MRNPINPITIPVRKGFTLYIGPNMWRLNGERGADVPEWINRRFTAIVKVSDCPSHRHTPKVKAPTYWIPFQELTPWSYENLFALKHTLDDLLESDGAVYLHCEAGVDRSQALASLWLDSLGASSGGPLEEIPSFPSGKERVETLSEKGLVPAKTPEFLAAINRNPTAAVLTILLEVGLPYINLPNHPEA